MVRRNASFSILPPPGTGYCGLSLSLSGIMTVPILLLPDAEVTPAAANDGMFLETLPRTATVRHG